MDPAKHAVAGPNAPMASAGSAAMPGPPLSRARPHLPSQHHAGSSPAPPIAAAMRSPPPLQKPALTLPPGIAVGSQASPSPHLHLPGVRPAAAMGLQGAPQLGVGMSRAPAFAGPAGMSATGPGARPQRPAGPGGMDRMPLLVHGLAGPSAAMGMAPGVAPAILGAGGSLALPPGLGLQEVKGLGPLPEAGVPGAKGPETMQLRMKSLWAVAQTACKEMAAAHRHRLEQIRASDEAEEEAVQEAAQHFLRTAGVLSDAFRSDASSLTLLPGGIPEGTRMFESPPTEPGEQTHDRHRGDSLESSAAAEGGAAPAEAAEAGRKKGARKQGTRQSRMAEAAEAAEAVGPATATPVVHKGGAEPLEALGGGRRQKRARAAEDADPGGAARSGPPSAGIQRSSRPQAATDSQGPTEGAETVGGAVAGQRRTGHGMGVEVGLEDILEAAAYAMLRCGWAAARPGSGIQADALGREALHSKGSGKEEEERGKGGTLIATATGAAHAASTGAGAGTEAGPHAETLGAGEVKGLPEELSWGRRVLAQVEELANRLSRRDFDISPVKPDGVPWARGYHGSIGGTPGEMGGGARGGAGPPRLPRGTWAQGTGLPRSQQRGTARAQPGYVSRWSPHRPLLGAASPHGASAGQPWCLGGEGAAMHDTADVAMGGGRQEEGPGEGGNGTGTRSLGEGDDALSPSQAAILRLLSGQASMEEAFSRQMETDAEIAKYLQTRNFKSASSAL